MVFDAHRGTRGKRLPKGPVLHWFNRMTMSWLRRRRRRGPAFGFQLLILTTIGRHSGEERVNPVAWFLDEPTRSRDESWLIVASANGAIDNPGWYYNLAAHPDRARIEVDGRMIAVTAEQLHGEERARAWRRVTAPPSRMAAYQHRTDRELPVIRLVRRGD